MARLEESVSMSVLVTSVSQDSSRDAMRFLTGVSGFEESATRSRMLVTISFISSQARFSLYSALKGVGTCKGEDKIGYRGGIYKLY